MAGLSAIEALLLGKQGLRIRLLAIVYALAFALIAFFIVKLISKRRENHLIPGWFYRVFGYMVFFGSSFLLFKRLS